MRKFKLGSFLWLLVLGFGAGDAKAQPPTHLWPGVAPCAGTLQACINAAAEGDVVQIVTNTPVAENLNLPRSIALEAGSGFSPRLAAGFGISGSSVGSVSFNIAIRRIALSNASINLTHGSSAIAIIEIRHVDIDSTSLTSVAGIHVEASGSGAATIRITDNRLHVAAPFSDAVTVQFTGNNGSTALVDFNRIESVGVDTRWAILAEADAGSVASVDIVNNEVRGHYVLYGIGVSEGQFSSTTSTLTARVLGNVVVGRNRLNSGIAHFIKDGNISTKAFNNTVVGGNAGIRFGRWSTTTFVGSISGPMLNNLLAYNFFGFEIDLEFQVPGNADYNLLFGNTANFYAAGTHDLGTDPQLRSLTDVHVQTGSPVIGAGNGFAGLDFVSSGVGTVDADGLRRIKGPMDIGAYEFGDLSLRVRADTPSGNNFAINQAPVDGNPLASLFATVNVGAGPVVITDAHPTGVYYFSGLWRLFNQDLATMPVGVVFNAFAPRTGDGTFVHTATVANLSGGDTIIDLVELNNQPEKILLATSNWNPGASPGVYNNHTTSVGYAEPNWLVENNDFAAWAVGAAVNIYSQDGSPNAYLHTATSGNSSGAQTMLDHLLLNGTPCAQVNVTPRSGNHGNTTFDVAYDNGSQRWIIFNHTLPMANGAQFNIVIDPGQVLACAGVLMSDGFED